MLEEVMYTTRSAAQMVNQVRSHKGPAQTRTHAHCGIRVCHADHTLIDQIGYFPVERRRKAVCHMSDNLLANMQCPLSHRSVEPHRAFDGLRRRLRSPDHLDQRNQVWRIKRMSGYAALWMLALGLDSARSNPGSTRHQNGRRREHRMDARE